MTTTLCINCTHYFDPTASEDDFGNIICTRAIPSFVYGEQKLNKSPEEERTKGECSPSAIFYVERKPFSILSFFRNTLINNSVNTL